MDKIIIFGAGNYGLKAFDDYGADNVFCFADNDINKIGTIINEKKIIPIDELMLISKDYQIIIACREFYNIIEQFVSLGICNYLVYDKLKDIDVCFNTGKTVAANVQKDIISVLYAGNNIDTANFGCRATSAALFDILSCSVNINDNIYRNEMHNIFSNSVFYDDIYEFYENFKDSNKIEWGNLRKRIQNADAVVVNGEGSFIFQYPPRLDLYYFLIIFLICNDLNKPYYLLNSMFSNGTEKIENPVLLKSTLTILESAKLVTARDHYSYKYVTENNHNINIKYIPDALFSRYDFYNNNLSYFDLLLMYPNYFMPFDSFCNYDYDFDFSGDYIVFSGNSYAALFPNMAYECYDKIIKKLRIVTENAGMKFYIAESCSGDYILRKVAVKNRIPLIQVNTNINAVGYILQKSFAFISGRYHPSILASLGGASCIFMDSNSHKTQSLQEVLEIDINKRKTFSAIPNDNEIEEIVSALKSLINNYDDVINERSHIKEICKKNMILTNEIKNIFS